jgi:valyl-tRNA synthetase
VLFRCLKDIILLIYPYTPFIAEELYLNLPIHKESIMLETYPKYETNMVHSGVDKQIDVLFSIIRDVRNYKIENKLAPNAKLDLSINLRIKMFKGYENYLQRFTFSEIKLVDDTIVNMSGELKIYDNADLLIVNEAGKEEIIARIDKEIAEEENEILRCQKMLSNPNFVSKAPKEKVKLEEEKLKQHTENLALLKEKKNKLM